MLSLPNRPLVDLSAALRVRGHLARLYLFPLENEEFGYLGLILCRHSPSEAAHQQNQDSEPAERGSSS